MFKQDWTTCLEYANHARLNSQHQLGALHDHLVSTRIFILVMDIYMSSAMYEENGYIHDLDY